jgi:hypothetical protein
MNHEHITFHLREAEEALARTIKELRDNPDYDFAEYWVAMQHLYYHFNTAWNGRDATPEQLEHLTDDLFDQWAKYPDPEDLAPFSS